MSSLQNLAFLVGKATGQTLIMVFLPRQFKLGVLGQSNITLTLT